MKKRLLLGAPPLSLRIYDALNENIFLSHAYTPETSGFADAFRGQLFKVT